MISCISRLFNREPQNEHMEVQGLASDYIDGELVQEQADKVRGHLDWCGPCLAFINTLRATIGLLGSSQQQEAPPSLIKRLRETLQREQGS